MRRRELLVVFALASAVIASGCHDEPAPQAKAPLPLPIPTLTVPSYREHHVELGPDTTPALVRIGDVDGDGRLDIVVAGTRAGRAMLEVEIGQADGTFRARPVETLASLPADLWIGDLDGDGRSELVTANSASGSLSILPDDGARFERRDIPFAEGPTSLAVADLDGDGLADIAASTASGLVGVCFGLGAMRCTPWAYFPLSAGSTVVRAGDLDGDGDLDLVVPSWETGEIFVLWNDGARALRAAGPTSSSATGGAALALGLFDDGALADLAVPLLDRGSVQILYGRGDGGFRRGPALAVGSGPRAVVVADLNADARPDLVVTNAESGDLTLLYGSHGRGFFSVAPIPIGKRPVETVVGDLDGDGLGDLVTVDAAAGSLSVLMSQREPEAIAQVALRNPLTSGDRSAIRGGSDALRRAVAAFRAGEDAAALRWLGKIISQSQRALDRNRLAPQSSPHDWRLMTAAMTLASDIHRYRLGQPAAARAQDLELARRAERAGDSLLTIAELIAVAEIERTELDKRGAAINTYAQVVYVNGPESAAPAMVSLLRTLAAVELDHLFASEPGYVAKPKHLEIPSPSSPELARLLDVLLPQLAAYGEPSHAPATYRNFSESHPHTLRGAAADYAAFRTALLLGAGYADVGVLHQALLERHPDNLLSLIATAQLAASQRALGNTREATGLQRRVTDMARRMGVALTPVTATAPSAPPAG